MTVACLFALTAMVGSAAAATATFSKTETIPVPPASKFAGSGGGDGWAVALSETAVYNVFHHQTYLGVSCHLQANAERCWSGREYDVITEPGTGDGFATSGQPGLYLDQQTGKLYVYATRIADSTAGVVCIDTTQPATDEDPFCGFTELTGKGEGPLVGGISGTSDPMVIGTHFYAFSFQSGVGQEGTKNTLLCFDLSTGEACSGQPYDVTLEHGVVDDGGFPSPATAAIAGKAIVPIDIEGSSYLSCFDDATQSSCGGSWPVKLSFGYASVYGAPFPLLDATGKTIGLCLPTGTDQCFNLEGESTTTPTGMTSVVNASDEWNGPGLALGPRVYLPNGNYEQVECFDYSTDESCTGYPKGPFAGLGYLYTVNPDPQRPSCIWINADNGADQIQNFDAYTGEGCGQGTIRVLASQFVVPQPECTPASYVSLQVLKPERSTYTSGALEFQNGDAEPIPGLSAVQLDGTGTASLVGKELNTSTGLPQFLFTLEGETQAVGEVEVKLTWTGNYEETCVGEGTEVTPATITLEPPTGKNLVGESHTVTAIVTNTQGEAIADHTVDFKVTEGPNAGLTGEGTTDSSGKATFKYSSSKTGTDHIVATTVIEEQPPVEDSVHKAATTAPNTSEITSNVVTELWEALPTKPAETPKPTPAVVASVSPQAQGGVLAFGTAHLASSAKACSATNSYLASVGGKDIASVTFTLNGHKLKTVTKATHGSFSLRVPVKTGKVEHLSIHVAFTAAASNHSETITKTLARCAAANPAKTPRFTG